MHFNIYLDDETGARLTEAAKEAGESRNALIRRAVQEWLMRHGKRQWPDLVLQHRGERAMPPFESSREHLAPDRDDPFA